MRYRDKGGRIVFVSSGGLMGLAYFVMCTDVDGTTRPHEGPFALYDRWIDAHNAIDKAAAKHGWEAVEL